MRDLFYFVAVVLLIIAVVDPEAVGSWMQAEDTAQFSCDTEQCWDPEAYY
jgi:hypothetical protein